MTNKTVIYIQIFRGLMFLQAISVGVNGLKHNLVWTWLRNGGNAFVCLVFS